MGWSLIELDQPFDTYDLRSFWVKEMLAFPKENQTYCRISLKDIPAAYYKPWYLHWRTLQNQLYYLRFGEGFYIICTRFWGFFASIWNVYWMIIPRNICLLHKHLGFLLFSFEMRSLNKISRWQKGSHI